MMADLIAESQKRLSVMESQLVGHEKLAEEGLRPAVDYILNHPDFTSYHLLFALKDRSEPAFASIPAAVRARVLCSALSNLKYLNDWGHLTVSPKHGPAMSALIATGEAALPCLKHLLEDRQPAPFFGSAGGTVAAQYRRVDFAYHAAALILNEKPVFAADPRNRDARSRSWRNAWGKSAPGTVHGWLFCSEASGRESVRQNDERFHVPEGSSPRLPQAG
ncbi:MAG TPA: hypothetical protein VK729_04275 [Silvibacterium sp.]|jgi:hypothetical protein|nr:hypothetical protein [Silvibacterium sp.]